MNKLLLVEDEAPMGEMYRDGFSKAGFEVVWALSAEQALEELNQGAPDLILLDLLLPAKNGLYFLEKLRQMSDKKISRRPVIILSNYDDPETRKKAIQLGVSDYLLKTDFTPKELVAEIKRIYKG